MRYSSSQLDWIWTVVTQDTDRGRLVAWAAKKKLKDNVVALISVIIQVIIIIPSPPFPPFFLGATVSSCHLPFRRLRGGGRRIKILQKKMVAHSFFWHTDDGMERKKDKTGLGRPAVSLLPPPKKILLRASCPQRTKKTFSLNFREKKEFNWESDPPPPPQKKYSKIIFFFFFFCGTFGMKNCPSVLSVHPSVSTSGSQPVYGDKSKL